MENYLRGLEEPQGYSGESVGGGAAEPQVHQKLRRVHLTGEEHAVHTVKIEVLLMTLHLVGEKNVLMTGLKSGLNCPPPRI